MRSGSGFLIYAVGFSLLLHTLFLDYAFRGGSRPVGADEIPGFLEVSIAARAGGDASYAGDGSGGDGLSGDGGSGEAASGPAAGGGSAPAIKAGDAGHGDGTASDVTEGGGGESPESATPAAALDSSLIIEPAELPAATVETAASPDLAIETLPEVPLPLPYDRVDEPTVPPMMAEIIRPDIAAAEEPDVASPRDVMTDRSQVASTVGSLPPVADENAPKEALSEIEPTAASARRSDSGGTAIPNGSALPGVAGNGPMTGAVGSGTAGDVENRVAGVSAAGYGDIGNGSAGYGDAGDGSGGTGSGTDGAVGVGSKKFLPSGSVDVKPEYVRKAALVYPPSEIRYKRELDVILEAYIDETGVLVKALIVQSGGEAFDEAAMNWLKETSFTPAKSGNQPVAVWIRIPVRFRLGP